MNRETDSAAAVPAPEGPRRQLRRALVSVYDKTGVAELAVALHEAGCEIVSTGSTAAAIEGAGVPVTRVETLTGFPECLDGRVKTLHPAVHAGLLADHRNPTHAGQLDELGIAPFDLLVSNLYPFFDTVASGAGADDCVEQIDIGGPAMVRAAAKNHASVAVVTSPAQYADVRSALRDGGFTLADRQRLAATAFARTATYDVSVASWLGAVVAPPLDGSVFPEWAGATWQRGAVLRYGENPHQRAAVYGEGTGGLAHAEQLHGKEMSYNNYVDADAAMRAAYDFAAPAVAIVKHANPCGIACGVDVAAAHRKAHACDPVSAYGGVIAVNRPLSVEMAEQVSTVFTEVVVAPSYEAAALEILRGKKNIRLLIATPSARPVVRAGHESPAFERTDISGGVLVQTVDRIDALGDDPATWTLAAGDPNLVNDEMRADLAFAWRAVRSVKSNAVLLAYDQAAVGVGMGQVNRVDAARLAVSRAGERASGSVAASDAFFPFVDGLQVLLEAGVAAIVEPGGSVRDAEVIAAAVAAGVPLFFTGTRHFYH